MPYEEIARRGGGRPILSTLRVTRAADQQALEAASAPRIKSLLAEGVTTIEIKSGYGLNLETEARTLRAARALGNSLPVRVSTSFLGAHAVPPEFAGRSGGQITSICDEMLPALAKEGLADAVDAFSESIALSLSETAVQKLQDEIAAALLVCRLEAVNIEFADHSIVHQRLPDAQALLHVSIATTIV